MKSQARVAVIGGGVVGVGTLYHLTKKGWSDVVLVERKELTSGSTWHAAGLLPLFNVSYSVGQIHKYSLALYETLEKETGQNVGLVKCSNIRLAKTRERMDEYNYYAGIAKTISVDVRFLTPDEVKEIWPLCYIDGIIGAIQHLEDGYIQPADLTQALATGARNRGAEIYRNTTVTGIDQKPNGEWTVKTDKGDIVCEHVVSATGNFAAADRGPWLASPRSVHPTGCCQHDAVIGHILDCTESTFLKATRESPGAVHCASPSCRQRQDDNAHRQSLTGSPGSFP